MKKMAVKDGSVKRTKVSRPGVHAKTKTSKSKTSKNYKKLIKQKGSIIILGVAKQENKKRPNSKCTTQKSKNTTFTILLSLLKNQKS